MFELREYQKECIDTAIANIKRGIRRQLIVLPTGGGKTVVAASIPQMICPQRILFLAHREELLNQAANTFQKVYPKLRVGVECGDSTALPTDPIVIGSVPTLGRRKSSRLARVFPDGGEEVLVITDECHHSYADTYKRIYSHFGLLGDNVSQSNLHIGITATPFRGDGKQLTDIFDEIGYMKKMGDLILDGWLADINSYHIKTDTDISKVKTSVGDFNVKELSETINTEDRNKLTVNSYNSICPGSKAIVFCADIKHANDMAEAFSLNGIVANVVSSETESSKREQLIEEFRSGKYKVITNCSVLTEGFDVPDTESIIIARPTRSPVLFTQMIGRGMRIAEGKDKMTLIDMYDRTAKPPIHIDRVINVPIAKCGYKDWKEIKEFMEKSYDFASPDSIAMALEPNDANDLLNKLKTLDIMKVLSSIYEKGVDSFMASRSSLLWNRVADGSYLINCAGVGKVAVRINAIGLWELWYKPIRQDWIRKHKGTAKECFKEGEGILAKHEKDYLYKRSASWRNRPASLKQFELIKRLSGREDIPISINNKGKASYIINALIASKRK